MKKVTLKPIKLSMDENAVTIPDALHRIDGDKLTVLTCPYSSMAPFCNAGCALFDTGDIATPGMVGEQVATAARCNMVPIGILVKSE